jgi:hypothetical protein
MQQSRFLKAGLLTLFLLLVLTISWESYLRNKGMRISYDDGPELWSDKRAKVYQPSDKATVFIGSSRIKFDLDIATWRKLTGEDAIQLAIEGESPTPILHDLAADKNFNGKLVVDVTEGLFFSSSPVNTTTPKKYIDHFKKETPSQKFSFQLNHLAESKLVFLDKHYFSLEALWDKAPVPKRKGVFAMPHDFPIEFQRKNFDRQTCISPNFLVDTNLQRQVTSLWEFFASMNEEKPATGAKLDSFLLVIKNDVNQITARGGQVLFVRTPSSGPYWMEEQKAFPRKQYWDYLLKFTDAPGIHFADYRAIDHFVCPEWSHLSQPDAIVFTKNFVQILEEKGWKFNKQ